ncbi:MAG TPA: hypothetical protein VG713_10765, partial [Pirellulales bacterium]|nr:hypothetical protein [Pirellulales bacterium]
MSHLARIAIVRLGGCTVAWLLIVVGVSAQPSAADALPHAYMVLLLPADVAAPPGVERRLTQIADYTELFFHHWMAQWAYPPANKQWFVRESSGAVRVITVRGDRPVASGYYDKSGFQGAVVDQAVRENQIPRNRHLWWIWVYLGENHKPFLDFRGGGNVQRGGDATAGYLALPGDVRSDVEMAAGFHRTLLLKGDMHEFGHAFGLPHIGPQIKKPTLGNSLMGPVNDAFASKMGPADQRVYLDPASAAWIWKHPIFTRESADREHIPTVA